MNSCDEIEFEPIQKIFNLRSMISYLLLDGIFVFFYPLVLVEYWIPEQLISIIYQIKLFVGIRKGLF